jgi:hypothetical protein
MGLFNNIFGIKKSAGDKPAQIMCPDCNTLVEKVFWPTHRGGKVCEKRKLKNQETTPKTFNSATPNSIDPAEPVDTPAAASSELITGNAYNDINTAIDLGHELEILYTGQPDRDGNRKPTEQRVIIPTGWDRGRNGKHYIRAHDVTKEGKHKNFLVTGIEKILESRPSSVQPIPKDPDEFTPLRITGPDILDPILTAQPARTPKIPAPTTNATNPLSLYTEELRTGTVTPTPEEYEELRSLDIDPDTHDKATIRRLRNNSASHLQLKSVAEEHSIPYEDYETALINNDGNHLKAVEEAKRYQELDREQIAKNQKRLQEFPNYASSRLLSDEDHFGMLSSLFLHHLNLKNTPEFSPDSSGPYLDIPGRRRANEWIMNEISKVEQRGVKKNGEPRDLRLRTKIDSPVFTTLETLQGDNTIRMDGGANINYFDLVNNLSKHHDALYATSTNVKDIVKQRRIRKALSHVGNSRFYPNDYSPDLYEEA